MNPLRVLRYRLRAFFRRSALDREMDEEMRFHLEMVAREHEAAGHSPEEARRRARLEFGGVDRKQEEVRDARGVRGLDDLVQDVRYGLRVLRRSPVFTTVAVLSLGLGIGANTAVFSLVNAVLLRSLPVPNPQELRTIDWTAVDDSRTSFTMTGRYNHQAGERMGVGDPVSYPVFTEVREQSAGRAEVFGFTRLDELIVQLPGASFVASGLMVSDNFFVGLGVEPLLGRVFHPTDAEAEAQEQVVVSHDWWVNHLGGDPGALGRSVTLNGHPFTVTGILPPGVRGLHNGARVDFYVSMAAQPALRSFWDRTAEDRWWIVMMARLAPGTSDEQFQAVAGAAFTNAVGDGLEEAGLIIRDGRAGLRDQRDYYSRPLLILLGIVGVVILVACANLAGLSLARGQARAHEFAIRPALGAGRGRLLRQSLTESLLLGLLGGAVGVAVALPAKAALSELLLGSTILAGGLHYDPVLDLQVLGFTLALAILAGVLAGLLPALRASRGSPLSGLKGRGTVGSPRLPAGRALIVGQMALSVLLVVGAGLYGRTLLNLVRIDPGFDTDHLLVFRLNPVSSGYDEDRVTAFYDDVTRALSAIPGVRSVAFSEFPLLYGWMSGGGFFTLPDHPSDEEDRPTAHRLTVSEPYFATMGIPILLGRGFEPTDDEGAAGVAVVNETFVRSYLGAGSPIGQRLHADDADWTVVGVSSDAMYTDLKAGIPPTVYFSVRQTPRDGGFFVLRTQVRPLTLADEVRAAVRGVDASVPVAGIQTQLQIRDGRIGQERLFAWLVGALAALALLLCGIGLFGLMAYDIARRTGEIGVRVALGATRHQVVAPVLREALTLVLVGLANGLPVALAAVRVVRNQLYGVEPTDPASLAAGGVMLVGVALLATWFPARRALKISPSDALRAE
jgi:predicted permease